MPSGNTTANLAPGSPAGSYGLSGFESINPFSGRPNFSLPLLSLGGRGKAGYSINLNIQRNWSVIHNVDDPNLYQPLAELYDLTHSYTPTDQTDGVDNQILGFSPGKMKGNESGTNRSVKLCYVETQPKPCYDETLTRLAFVQSDGTEIEFRDVLYGGKAITHTSGSTLMVSRGTQWVSTDGSNATFIASADIYDHRLKDPGFGATFYPSGTLYFSNGTKYTIVNGSVTQIIDINGNKVVPGTDSLGREVTVTEPTEQNPFKTLGFKGTSGAARTIKIYHSSLEDTLSSGYSLSDLWELFPAVPIPEGTTDMPYDPGVVSSVDLPDGREYTFGYNQYGELTEITLPTGGKIEYVWQPSPGTYGSQASGEPTPNGPPDDELGFRIYRRVEKRRVYEGGVLQNETVYGTPVESSPGSSVTVETYANQAVRSF